MRLVIAVVLALSATASAGDLTKEACLDAHSKGQDAKEAGKLSLARKLFLTCAQSSCPSLVQGDCARFADDLSRLQPTVSFAARDSNGADFASSDPSRLDELARYACDIRPPLLGVLLRPARLARNEGYRPRSDVQDAIRQADQDADRRSGADIEADDVGHVRCVSARWRPCP